MLKDVAGMNVEKVEIQEFINFLKEPKVCKDIGTKMPKQDPDGEIENSGKTFL